MFKKLVKNDIHSLLLVTIPLICSNYLFILSVVSFFRD